MSILRQLLHHLYVENLLNEIKLSYLPIFLAPSMPISGRIFMISLKDIIAHLGNFFGEDILNLPPDPSQDILDRPEGG